MENDLAGAIEKLKDFSFPRYADLPEIELYMDQVISVSEKYLGALAVKNRSIITPSMINNYVKNGVISPPERKRYTRDHLASIIIICALKQTVEITDIAAMIRKMTELFGMEETFDTFAALYEKYMSELVGAARDAHNENGEKNIYRTIVDNAILSSTARTVVEYALTSANAPEEPQKESAKPKRKKSRSDGDDDEISIFPVI